MAEDPQIVKSLDGLYDETARHTTYNLADRKRCFRHHWETAYAHWSRIGNGHFDIVGEAWPRDGRPNFRWMRLCTRCKQIDCVHSFEEKQYRVVTDEFYHENHTIGHCRICQRRISLGGGGVCQPSPEASQLIAETVAATGRKYWRDKSELCPDWTGLGSNATYAAGPTMGSGFYLELPVWVSRQLRNGVPRERIQANIRLGLERGLGPGGLHIG